MLMHDTGTGNYKEESEPLGQTIEPTDLSPGFPTEYADVLGDARDPEWQCDLPDEFYGGFFAQPGVFGVLMVWGFLIKIENYII